MTIQTHNNRKGAKIMQTMDNNKILQKIKENFKKKRGRWKIEVGEFDNFSIAYDKAHDVLDWLSTCFDEDEKEKYMFNKMAIGVTPATNTYNFTITYKR